jgi:creatinine amidohydrolase
MTEVEWSRLTGPELRQLASKRDSIAVLPVGSLEQHGLHLPTNTDTASAHAAAVRAARLVSDTVPIAVLPGLWLGLSEHHFPFGGTVSIDFAAYAGLLRGVARSLRVLGFARLLIVNGHGGNVEALAVIVRELSVECAMPIVATTPWYLAEPETRAIFESSFDGRHACEGETSIMLAISPETVRTDKIPDVGPPVASPFPQRSGFVRFYSFAEIAPGRGSTGDPRRATAEKGEKFLNIHARELAAGILDEHLWTAPDPVWQCGRGLEDNARTLAPKVCGGGL